IIMRRRMMGRTNVEERIEEPGEIAAEKERGDARLVGLERKRDDVAHEPHVLADILREAVLGTRHFRIGRHARPGLRRLAVSACRVDWAGRATCRVCSTRFSTSRTLVRYSSSLALSALLTCRWSAAVCSCTRSRMLSVRRLPWLSKRLSNASDG